MATRTTKTAAKSTTTRSRTTKPKTTAAKSKTTTKPKTTAKSAAPAKTAAKAAPAAAPVVVDAPTPVVAGPMMRKKELVDAVVARSGMKKKDVKPAVEATLAVLGEALQDGRALNLQPMGKVKINREKKLASGRLLIARIRQNEASDKKPAEDTPAVTDTSDKAAAE